MSLPHGSLWLDVWALWDGSLPADEIGGELLASAEPRNCPSFDVWLMLARGRCAARSMEELRQAALRLLAEGKAEAAAEAAGRAAGLDPLDEGAQELFLRTLVAAGHPARATVHLASCEAALRAQCLAADGHWNEARDDAEQAFTLACQLGDPCWEGMAGRAIALLALHDGRGAAAVDWVTDAQRRCDRVSDRYVWVSGYVTLGHLEIAARQQPDLVIPLARGLYQDAVRADLPEFTAWALIYQAEAGDTAQLPLARAVASQVVNPALQERAAALG